MTIGSEAATYQRLRDHLHVLRLSAAAEALPGMLDDARGADLSTVAMLEQLLAVEVETTQARRLASRAEHRDHVALGPQRGQCDRLGARTTVREEFVDVHRPPSPGILIRELDKLVDDA